MFYFWKVFGNSRFQLLAIRMTMQEAEMKLGRVICSAVAVLAIQGIATVTTASAQDAIIARLEALEKENAALRQRLNRIERSGATTSAPRPGKIRRKHLNWKRHPALPCRRTRMRKAIRLPTSTRARPH